MQNIHYYLAIFVMGVLCSLTMMLIIKNFSLTKERRIPNYLSDVHYLQVRDDYSVYSLTSKRADENDEPYGKPDRTRNSIEGTALIISFFFEFWTYF